MATNSERKSELEGHFPKLRSTTYKIASPVDPTYNCIAWAAGDQDRWWEPDPMNVGYWPPSVPRERTLAAYQQAFENLGYTACDEEIYEEHTDKVALFAEANTPTHASRQLDSSLWTSKLGRNVDVTHELRGLCGQLYGDVARILSRPKTKTTE